jgi:hypothetical protein
MRPIFDHSLPRGTDVTCAAAFLSQRDRRPATTTDVLGAVALSGQVRRTESAASAQDTDRVKQTAANEKSPPRQPRVRAFLSLVNFVQSFNHLRSIQ